MTALLGVLLLAVFATAVSTVIFCLCLPAVSRAAERARIERAAAEASWRIHQQASAAFGEMLEAARQTEPGSSRWEHES